MKWIFLIVVIVLFPKIAFANVIINEIMANPIADESLNEWIELYNDGSNEVNVSGWIIGDDDDNDTIEGGLFNQEGTIIPALGFGIITDDSTRVYNNFNVSDDAVRLYVDDSSIGGFGLKNSGETIYLYDNNGNLIDQVDYSSTQEDLSWAFLNGSFLLSEATAGFNNDGSLTITTEDGCDFQVEFILASSVFENTSAFNFKIRASKVIGSKTNFTGRASIKDLFGTLIKEYRPWTNESITRQKTSSEYTPNLDEGKSYEMSANITLQCNDTNSINNFDTRIISIKGAPLEKESSFEILSIQDLGSDKTAKFGQTIRVRADIYKGDTTKNSVALWIEDDKEVRLSKQTRINIPGKFSSNVFTIPIQIKPNCNEKFKDDEYIIKIKGLDAENEGEVEIEGIDTTICKTITVEKKETTSSKNFKYEIIEMPSEIIPGEKFDIKLRLDNDDETSSDIKVWSYVFRGPKSYSGEREENKKEFVLKKRSSDVVELSNIVPEAEAGDYRLKIVINKDNQKTNKQITEDIRIMDEEIELKNEEFSDSEILEENKITQNLIKESGVVYESTTEKAKKLVVVFLLILSVFLNVILFWRR